MKLLLLFLCLYTAQGVAQKSIYDVTVPSLAGDAVQMSRYAGSKILIYSINTDLLQKGNLRFFDSLQTAFPTISLICIPADDFSRGNNDEFLTTLKNRDSKKGLVMASAKVKKEAKSEQNKLMQWLTNADFNRHFDNEVNTDEQIYVISETGVLYALLEKGVDLKTIDRVLNQKEVP